MELGWVDVERISCTQHKKYSLIKNTFGQHLSNLIPGNVVGGPGKVLRHRHDIGHRSDYWQT
jgi:hypothetical protein